MINLQHSEAGSAGPLTLPPDKLRRLGVSGFGHLWIDEEHPSPRIAWNSHCVSNCHVSDSQVLPSVEESKRKIASPHETRSPHLDAYRSRMEFLQDEALHEGLVINWASRDNFEAFIRQRPGMRKGDLVLMDNGNLRATWKDDHEALLGLQFLGGMMVQFVIFKRRDIGQPVSRVAGRDDFKGLDRQIVAFELSSLLYE